LQRSVQAANARRPAGSRLEVCIGIGWGKLLRIGTEDIHGDQMNLACKLGEDIARPRQILLTEAAYEEVHRLKAAGGLRFERRRLRISGVQLVHYSIRPPR
jgi:class 3 adenylate cyclase